MGIHVVLASNTVAQHQIGIGSVSRSYLLDRGPFIHSKHKTFV